MPNFFVDNLKPGPLLRKRAVFLKFHPLRRDRVAIATRGFSPVNDVSNGFYVTLSLLIIESAEAFPILCVRCAR